MINKIKIFFNTSKLSYKYRFIIQNEDSLEDRYSIRLSRVNIITIVGIASLLLIFITSLVIIYTPIREYIPGYTPIKDKRELYRVISIVDSIAQKMNTNDNYIHNLKNILRGEGLTETKIKKRKEADINKVNKDINDNILATKDEIDFRDLIEKQEKYNIFEEHDEAKESTNFFPPVKGVVSFGYSNTENHKAVDILCKRNTPVKAILKGVVLFSEWSVENGSVIILLHPNNIISIYKHNSKAIKNQGDYVEQGEVVAFSGSEGEHSTGPHLHFELWIDNIAVDSREYIDF